jgi:hypothetical protein
MGKPKVFLLVAVLASIGTSVQAQSVLKQDCIYQGRAYSDGTTNPIVRCVIAALGGRLPRFKPPSSAFMSAEPFLMGQAMLRERFATARPALGNDAA